MRLWTELNLIHKGIDISGHNVPCLISKCLEMLATTLDFSLFGVAQEFFHKGSFALYYKIQPLLTVCFEQDRPVRVIGSQRGINLKPIRKFST